MKSRDGFTVVEVLLALVLLSFVIMGFQAATAEIVHSAAQSDRATVAAQLAEDRLERIRLDPDYGSLAAQYAGVERGLEGFEGLARTTRVSHRVYRQEAGILDYTVITVTVDGDGLRAPVSRTAVVAAP